MNGGLNDNPLSNENPQGHAEEVLHNANQGREVPLPFQAHLPPLTQPAPVIGLLQSQHNEAEEKSSYHPPTKDYQCTGERGQARRTA